MSLNTREDAVEFFLELANDLDSAACGDTPMCAMEVVVDDTMRDRLIAALRAAIVEIEAGRLSGVEFFARRTEDGVEHFDTPEQAEQDMEREMEVLADASASYGWHENTDVVCWGLAVPVVVYDSVNQGPESGYSDFDYMVDYEPHEWLGQPPKATPFDPVAAYAHEELPVEHDGDYWYSPGVEDPIATITYSVEGGWCWTMGGEQHKVGSYEDAREQGNRAALGSVRHGA